MGCVQPLADVCFRNAFVQYQYAKCYAFRRGYEVAQLYVVEKLEPVVRQHEQRGFLVAVLGGQVKRGGLDIVSHYQDSDL